MSPNRRGLLRETSSPGGLMSPVLPGSMESNERNKQRRVAPQALMSVLAALYPTYSNVRPAILKGVSLRTAPTKVAPLLPAGAILSISKVTVPFSVGIVLPFERTCPRQMPPRPIQTVTSSCASPIWLSAQACSSSPARKLEFPPQTRSLHTSAGKKDSQECVSTALRGAVEVLTTQGTRHPDNGGQKQSRPHNEEHHWHVLYQTSIWYTSLSLMLLLLSEFKLLSKIAWRNAEPLLNSPEGVPPVPHVHVSLLVAPVPHDGEPDAEHGEQKTGSKVWHRRPVNQIPAPGNGCGPEGRKVVAALPVRIHLRAPGSEDRLVDLQ